MKDDEDDDIFSIKKKLFEMVEKCSKDLKKQNIKDITIKKRLIHDGNKVKWHDGVSYEIIRESSNIKITKLKYYYDNENSFKKLSVNTTYSVISSETNDLYKITEEVYAIKRIIAISKFLSE